MATQAPQYEIEYHCNNCNYFFKAKFLVGAPAPKKIICTRCGVLDAEKSWRNPNPWPKIPMDPCPPVVPWDDRPWYPGPRIPRPAPRPTWPWKPYPPRPRRGDQPIIWNRRIGGDEGQRDFLC